MIINQKALSSRVRAAENSQPQRRNVEVRKQRSDGAEARERLLQTALKLFAEKGFAKTSTREIVQAAGVNISSIAYYFGDKAGLYRAVFTEPLGSPGDGIALYDQPHFTLRQSLAGFFSSILDPMKQGDQVRLCMRLHFREMLEPTGLWAETIDNGIKPAHAALVAELPRYHVVKEKVYCPAARAYQAVNLVRQHFQLLDVPIDLTDGVRVDWPDAWVHVRASSTEPLVRVICEATSRARALEISGDIAKRIQQTI